MKWESPISYNAKSMTRATRQILDQLDVIYTRDSTHTSYSRFMVVMPLPEKLAYTYLFQFHHPHEFSIHYYDTKPAHSGIMSFMKINNYKEKDIGFIQGVLKRLLAYFERPPWKFTFGMRLMHGCLLPEFRRAKKAWMVFDCLTLTDEEQEKFNVTLKEGAQETSEGSSQPGENPATPTMNDTDDEKT